MAAKKTIRIGKVLSFLRYKFDFHHISSKLPFAETQVQQGLVPFYLSLTTLFESLFTKRVFPLMFVMLVVDNGHILRMMNW